MDAMNPNDFRRMFRMKRESFTKLETKLAEKLKINVQKGINSSGSSISVKTRLAATIRWLAGGSYHDICFSFGLDPSNFFNKRYVLWPTIVALDGILELGFSLDEESLSKVAAGFEAASNGQLRGCVSAIDGWVCRTRCPKVSEAGMAVKNYRNRKGFWGIVVLAGCDAKCRFNIFSAQWSGGTHDCLAWEGCMMKQVLDAGLLPEQYFAIGDEAFVNRPQFLVPWSGRGLGPWKDSFNYHLSSARQCIERAFGILTKHWGIFWRPLQCALDRWGLVCTVAAKLHNFCIDEKEIDVATQHPKNIADGDFCVVIDNDEEEDEVVAALRPRGKRRVELTRRLQRDGILRPRHAFANSRA